MVQTSAKLTLMVPSPHVVILAAGKGTRMKSALPKVLHRVAGSPMIDYVLDTAATLQPQSQTLVLGHQANQVKAALASRSDLTFVVQEPQLGTAHALLAAETALVGARGAAVLLSGDVPLLSPNTVKTLLQRHVQTDAAVTVLTAVVERPDGYGRVVRSGERIARIVEDKDASPAERETKEINAGIYVLALDGLFDAIRSLAAGNAQNEYYLPDLVGLYHTRGLTVESVVVGDSDEVHGINSRAELAVATRLIRQATNQRLMAEGVTLEDPATTYIDRRVQIGADTVIHPGVAIEGVSTLGIGCEIHGGTRIVNSQLGSRVTVHNHSLMVNDSIGDDASIGPFARLRPDVTIGPRAQVGNFVEMKKTSLGEGSKAMHLSYLGDAVIGDRVNVGAGTITCNYDGSGKYTTTIERGAFIGSDTQLVAPVTIGENAYVGTGTTVREDVPAGSLAVSAGKQRNIENWVKNRKDRQ